MRTLTAVCALAVVTAALGQYGDISDVKLLKPEDKEHVKSTPPPDGAIVLFDGKSLDGWVKTDGKTAPEWKLTDGAMEVAVKTGSIMTKEKFDGDFKLHIEFRVPYLPSAKGQQRGNSGVYVQGRYEVQVLDSYGLDSMENDCGAIYEVAKPTVNACKAPTIWQSYDIEFRAPKFADGKPVEPARMTVYHNGVKIHDDVKLVRAKDGKEEVIINTRAGLGGDPSKPGPLMLQDHGDSPVQYRNVWVLKSTKGK
jgi:hypothetical protein